MAKEAGITPSAMTRVLEKLEGRNLVQRVRGAAEDGRAAKVAITSHGREVRASIDKLMRQRRRLDGAAGGIDRHARRAVVRA